MTTRTVSAVASFKGRRFCRPSAPSIGDFSPTSAIRHESVSTTSNRLSLGSHARGCPRACVSASGQAPSAARRDLRPPSTEWRCPLQGHTSRASWVRGQIDVKRRTGLLTVAIARRGSATPTRILLGHLLSQARGSAGWRGRHAGTLSRPSYEPTGVRSRAQFPGQASLEPTRTCFREARAP